jgi:hypothetical protein
MPTEQPSQGADPAADCIRDGLHYGIVKNPTDGFDDIGPESVGRLDDSSVNEVPSRLNDALVDGA